MPNTRARGFMFNSHYEEGIIISIFQRKLRLRVSGNLLKVTELVWSLSGQDLNRGLSKFITYGHDQEDNLCC